MRQLVRTVKELQAGTSSDVASALDHRFQTFADQIHRDSQLQAEAMLKLAEVMGEKIDRLQTQLDESVGSDIQIVVDRMSDAIQAMSSARRRDIA
jgi:predicted KAP-like P-loop ATPase